MMIKMIKMVKMVRKKRKIRKKRRIKSKEKRMLVMKIRISRCINRLRSICSKM